MTPTVMVVGNDDRMRTDLCRVLAQEGYDVTEAVDARTARTDFVQRPPDAMLVDLSSARTDVLGCLRAVRRDHDLPVIVLSTLSESGDLVAALDAGADDYVSRPLEVREIIARLRALRRRAGTRRRPGAVADLVLDADPHAPLVLSPATATVRRGDRDVNLTRTEYRLLCVLAHARGRVLSRQALVHRVWARGSFGDERVVDVHIRRLRAKIEHDSAHPRVVATVRGSGYRLDIHTRSR